MIIVLNEKLMNQQHHQPLSWEFIQHLLTHFRLINISVPRVTTQAWIKHFIFLKDKYLKQQSYVGIPTLKLKYLNSVKQSHQIPPLAQLHYIIS